MNNARAHLTSSTTAGWYHDPTITTKAHLYVPGAWCSGADGDGEVFVCGFEPSFEVEAISSPSAVCRACHNYSPELDDQKLILIQDGRTGD
jgi:hypothetical protein